VSTTKTVHDTDQTRTETKNAIGKLAAIIDAAGQTVRYQYDSDGNLTDVIDPQQNDTHTHYDTRNRKDWTTDPDMGHWTYSYNGFGDLVGQVDAKNQAVSLGYDVLGRLTSRIDHSKENTSQWIYDTAPGAGVGKLAAVIGDDDSKLNGYCAAPVGASVPGGSRPVKQFWYDSAGNVQRVDECYDGTTFVTTYEYDALGRQSLVRYPAASGSQLTVGYHYTTSGFLHYLTDESTDYSLLWLAKEVDGGGNVVREQTRNGVETVTARNQATGWVTSTVSTAHYDGETVIQNLTNTVYDEAGNLRERTRSDQVNDSPSSESFDYDALNRLVDSRVQLPALKPAPYDRLESYGYDALGNLTSRSGALNVYQTGCVGVGGPHALCTVAGGGPYEYDPNGNMTNGGGRAITYNTANKPVQIVDDSAVGGGVVGFAYDADGGRVLQVLSSGATTARTVYVGLGGTGKSLYERTTTSSDSGSTVEHTYFIYAGGVHGGNALAVRVLDGSGTFTDRYFNFDHLGSTTVVSDSIGHAQSAGAAGAFTGPLGYDPWGGRRSPDGQAASAGATFQSVSGHREFTGQETIPGIGLINMNGRVYDPELGRFLSPDPNVQSPNNLQSYNRYSYVLNNPMRYTDPTGYLTWGSVEAALPGVFITAMSVAACAGTGGVACGLIGVTAAILTAGVARADGESWTQVGSNFVIGMAAGTLGGAAGSALGGALGAAEGSAAEFAAAEVGGAIGGAVGGALSTLAVGGDLGENMLLGAAQGVIWAGVGWGMKQPSALTRGDKTASKGGGSGAARLEKRETVDSVLAQAGITGKRVSADELLLDMNEADSWRQSGQNPTSLADAPVVVTDYGEAETRAILGRAVGELQSHFYPVAMAEFARNIIGIWDFKSLPTGPEDTYMLGGKRLSAGEFGNYFAGYVAQARFGLFGAEAAMAGGELFNVVNHLMGDPDVPTFFDPAHDQYLIVSGATDATTRYGYQLW
jgi:RHS repeat-associated protein